MLRMNCTEIETVENRRPQLNRTILLVIRLGVILRHGFGTTTPSVPACLFGKFMDQPTLFLEPLWPLKPRKLRNLQLTIFDHQF